MILLTTVKHSGTNSLKALIGGDVELRHCSDDIWQDLDKYDSIVTTYRDPLRVAASWANRGLFSEHDHLMERTWRAQWRNWVRIYPLARVYPVDEMGIRLNRHDDIKGLHKALDDGDIKTYYRQVPINEIDYVLNLTREAHGAKSVETYLNERCSSS